MPKEFSIDWNELGVLNALFDYAGLFPPAELNPTQAVAEFLEQVQSPRFSARMARFVFPLTKKSILLQEFEKYGDLFGQNPITIPCTVLLPQVQQADEAQDLAHAVDALVPAFEKMEFLQLRIDSVEYKLNGSSQDERAIQINQEVLRQLIATSQVLPNLDIFVEQDWKDPASANVQEVIHLQDISNRVQLKIRTGGMQAESVPSPEILTELITCATAANVPFKCTAGLHSALRETSPRFGFPMHGFVNVLCATAAALVSSSAVQKEHIMRILEAESKEELENLLEQTTQDDTEQLLARARECFLSIGSCSVLEPHESLEKHGFLAEA